MKIECPKCKSEIEITKETNRCSCGARHKILGGGPMYQDTFSFYEISEMIFEAKNK